MPGLIGKKVGMTSVFSAEGKSIPCTVIEAGPCVVTQIKTVEKEIIVTEKEYLGVFKITHYCGCAKCCGIWAGKPNASGKKSVAGRTVAVNRNRISLGTTLQIGGKEGYVAEDTGGGLGLNTIDVFCNNDAEARSKGVRYEKVWKIKQIKKVVKKKCKYPIYAKLIGKP